MSDLGRSRRGRAARWLAPVAAAPILVASVAHSSLRTPRFLRAPAISLQGVEDLARRLRAASAASGIERPTVAMPDIGGALWLDEFRVVDLAGLTDRALGRHPRREPTALASVVLERRRPDLLWTHPYWTRRLRWRESSELRRDDLLAWSSERPGAPLAGSALFVRQDAGVDSALLGRFFAERSSAPRRQRRRALGRLFKGASGAS